MRFAFVWMFVLMASPVAAQSWIVADEPGESVGQIHFDSGVRDCDGRVVEVPAYRFPVGVTITDVWLWQGSDAPLPGQAFVAVDLFAVLYASRPHGYKLLQAMEDRYAPPNSQEMHHRSLSRVLAAGDTVGGGFFCNALFGKVSHTHVGITVEYVKTLVSPLRSTHPRPQEPDAFRVDNSSHRREAEGRRPADRSNPFPARVHWDSSDPDLEPAAGPAARVADPGAVPASVRVRAQAQARVPDQLGALAPVRELVAAAPRQRARVLGLAPS